MPGYGQFVSASKPLAEMTVEELLVAYEQLPASERKAHAVELDSRGVLDGLARHGR